MWLPYVRGERTPLHRRDLRASLHGAALHHTPAHLLRAAYEAAGFVVRHHLDLAAGAGLGPGGSSPPAAAPRCPCGCGRWPTATGLPVDVAAVPEGAALGSAFVARCVAGREAAMTDASRWAATARTVEPDPAWRRRRRRPLPRRSGS